MKSVRHRAPSGKMDRGLGEPSEFDWCDRGPAHWASASIRSRHLSAWPRPKWVRRWVRWLCGWREVAVPARAKRAGRCAVTL